MNRRVQKCLLALAIVASLSGCAALERGWNDDGIRNNAQTQGQRVRDFVGSTTGNALMGAGAGAVSGLMIILVSGWRKK